MTTLRDRCGFRLLEVGGTDYLGYPKRDADKPRFEVHYVLLNQDTHERLILKVGVDDPNPTIPTRPSRSGRAPTGWSVRFSTCTASGSTAIPTSAGS